MSWLLNRNMCQPQYASHSKWADHPLTVVEQIVSTRAHMSPWDMKPSTTWCKLDTGGGDEMLMLDLSIFIHIHSPILSILPWLQHYSTVKGDSMVVKAELANRLLRSWWEKCKTRVKTRIRVRGSSIYYSLTILDIDRSTASYCESMKLISCNLCASKEHWFCHSASSLQRFWCRSAAPKAGRCDLRLGD